jgi:hypothetical protein
MLNSRPLWIQNTVFQHDMNAGFHRGILLI